MKRLDVEDVTPSCTYLRGHGVRELVTDVNGRPPVWATRSRAWVIQPSSLPDIVAEAERRGWDVRLPKRQEFKPSIDDLKEPPSIDGGSEPDLFTEGGEPWRPGPSRHVS